MPDYGSLLGMMGYDVGSISGLFEQFEDPLASWTERLKPAFGRAQAALGELPGLRGEMLGQLRGGLQERGVAVGRGLRTRRAGAGFAGAGALDRMGRTARRGIEQEYGRGTWGIGQDIARKEAGILGGLTGTVESFLGQLMAADTRAAPADDTGSILDPYWAREPVPEPPTGLPSYEDWLAAAGWVDTAARRREYQSFLEGRG